MKENLLSARRVAEIIRSKKWGKHHDGGGLFLVGSPTYKTFSWQLRLYRTATGKPRDLGLGSVRLFSLQEARERARKYRQLAVDGIDPIELRRQEQDAARAAASERITFKDAAEEFLAVHGPTWRNAKHQQQWRNTLATYAYPKLGPRPVSAIDGALITEGLAPIWMTKIETARRVKQRIERVCKWAKDGKALPQQGAARRVQHHAAMTFVELPGFMAKLRERNSISARALEFTILTAARTAEAVNATWDEVDFDNAVWSIPAGRMKAGRAHEVPLSKRVLEILRDLPRVGDHIFPGAREGRPLSNMAMLELLRGMAGNGYTTHGFRSSFRDWAGDRTHYAREVIEHALAHGIKDKAEAAYRRTAALEKRRKLMEAWASYCAAPASTATVTPLRGRA